MQKENLEIGHRLNLEVGCKILGMNELDSSAIPDYSRDPTSNKVIRDFLTKCRPRLSITFWDDVWEIEHNPYTDEFSYVTGNTLEHAICLAALEVIEEDRMHILTALQIAENEGWRDATQE